MMRLPAQRGAVVTPRLGGSPPVPSSEPQYPWVDGELLCAGALNTAIADASVLTDTVNVLNYGADPTGGADSCSAINAALATGKNVYVPAGTYLLRCMVTVGNASYPQTLYGTGLSTTFVIDDTFDPNAICVFVLRGAEYNACGIHDIRISFTQPTSTNGTVTRATFRTLANGGTSGPKGTGVAYPPAIMWSDASFTVNRFRLKRIRVEGAWDGIVQGNMSASGGWIMDDIEMGCLNQGLVICDNLDHAQVRSWHHWVFGVGGGLDINQVHNDGKTVAIQLGVGTTGAQGAGISFTNTQIFNARINMDMWGGGGTFFSNLMMDTTQAGITMTAGTGVHISNLYFSNAPGMTQPCIWLKPSIYGTGPGSPPELVINNIFGWSTNYPYIQLDAGILIITGGYIYPALNGGHNLPFILQNAGWLELSNLMFSPDVASPWTVSPIQYVNGVLSFHNNIISSQPSPPESGAPIISFARDDYRNVVTDNAWSGWSFVPPGPLGMYGPNSVGNPGAPNNIRFQGVNAQLASYYGTAPPYTNYCTMINVDTTGSVHLGDGSKAVVIDPPAEFVVGGAFVDNSGQGLSNPASGSSAQIPDNCGIYLIETGGIAALTLTLPVNPKVNQQLRIWSEGTITSFTLLPSTGQTLPATVTTLTANRSLLLVWSAGPWLMLTGG